MFDTLESIKKLEDTESENSSQAPLALLIRVETSDSRPDAVSTVLICSNRIELYGVQQLSNAVESLEEKQTSYLWGVPHLQRLHGVLQGQRLCELPAQALPVPAEGEDEAVRRVSPRLPVRILRHSLT